MNKNFEFYESLIIRPEESQVRLWDLVVITAINEKQKLCYENQIKSKLENEKLPKQFQYLVTNDPADCKIGSGGSTLNVIRHLYDLHGEDLYKMKILLIHAGGYSQRMPSCSMLGKIFYPIATKNAYINDMLDMKLAIYTPFSVHMSSGVFLTSSDDIETFGFDEQVETSRLFCANSTDFILIAHKSSLEIAKDHGCYGIGEEVKDDSHSQLTSIYECECVLQKPSIESMKQANLIQNEEFVYTDSVFYFTHTVIHDLLFYSRCYYEQICDLNIEIDAYRDFLQPLGSKPVSLEVYLENAKCTSQNLKRTIFENLYKIISQKRSLVVALDNSIFYHLGTVSELFELYLSGTENEYSANFRKNIDFTNIKNSLNIKAENEAITNVGNCCLVNTRITPANVHVSSACLLEYCYFNLENTDVRLNINSHCYLNNCYLNTNELTSSEHSLVLNIPSNICMHTVPVNSDSCKVNYVTIFFSKSDNLKAIYSNFGSIKFLNRALLMNDSTTKYDSSLLSGTSTQKYTIWNLKAFKSEQTMSKSFISAINFINSYTTSKTTTIHEDSSSLLFNNMLALNTEESSQRYYSLFDLLNCSNHEAMIAFRNTHF